MTRAFTAPLGARYQEFLNRIPRFTQPQPQSQSGDNMDNDVIMPTAFLDTPLVGDTTLRQHLMQVIDSMSAIDARNDDEVTMLLAMREQLRTTGMPLLATGTTHAASVELLRRLLHVKTLRQDQGTAAMTLPAYAALMKLRQDWEGWVSTTPTTAGAAAPASEERST